MAGLDVVAGWGDWFRRIREAGGSDRVPAMQAIDRATLASLLATLNRMTTVPLGEARDHLPEYVADVERTPDRVVITRHGHPAAVLISPEELEGLEITIEALADPETMKNVRDAEDAIARGETYDEAAVRAALARRRAASV